MSKRVWIAALATMVGGLVSAPSAGAQPVCEHRSAAHAAEHGTTVEADSRWHVARGELPTCMSEPASNTSDTGKSERFDDRDKDRKSRYCRKHWFC